MNNNDYMTPKGRTNNFISSQKPQLNPIHIFTNPNVLSPPISALKGECQRRAIPVEIYSDPNQLIALISRLKQKAFVVIETPRVTATQVSWVFPQKFVFPNSNDSLKIVTFPGKVSAANYEQAKQKNDVLTLYDKHFGLFKQSSKIKLRKVHSSKDIKYELASPKSIQQSKAGKEVFFQKLLYSDYKVQADSEFRLLTDAIKTTPNAVGCLNMNELKVAADGIQTKGSKVLFLVEERGLKEWREFVEKSKVSDKVEFMVLGELKPSRELMSSNVYFASDEGEQILNELGKLKLGEVDRCRSEYLRMSTAKKNQFKFSEQSIRIDPYVSPISSPQKNFPQPVRGSDRPQLHRLSEQFSASIFSNASSQFQRYMRNWTVDVDAGAMDRKVAGWVLTEEGKQHIDGPSQPMSKRASRNIARRNSSESSDEHYSLTANNLVDEYQRIKNKQLPNSTVNIAVPNDFQSFKMHNSQREITSTKQSSLTEEKSPNKKVIQIIKKPPHQTKHQQLPSNVIQQTSEEYRGSNRQSIVNMDDHFYHYSQGSGNNLARSAGNITGGNFSKVKNTALGPMVEPGVKKTVHQEQTYPAENRIINLGYDSPGRQDLPIDSPPHSEVNAKEKIIDSRTGKLVDNYGSKYEQNDQVIQKGSKKIYETISVVPYQANEVRTSGVGSNYESMNGFGDVKNLGYQASQTQSNQQNYQAVSNVSAQAFIIDELTGELLGDSYKRMQSVGGVSTYLQGNSVVSSVSKQQVVRPSHYIEPQVVKIVGSTESIREGSKQSIGREKQLDINGGYNIVSGNNIESVTSITETFGGSNKNHKGGYSYAQVIGDARNGTNYISSSYSQQRNKPAYQSVTNTQVHKNTVSTQRANSPSANYNPTADYAISANYKVYTPEEYAAKYETGANGSKTATVTSNSYTTTANPTAHNYANREYASKQYTARQITPREYAAKQYTTRQMTSGHNYTTAPQTNSSNTHYQSSSNYTPSKQPEVISRVYIKASDLPQSTSNNNYAKRFQTSPNHYTQDYRAKLTIQDSDPFNQRTPSKHSSMRKGSYLMRKEDGKRDPYSPYEENGSQLLANQRSAVKVYTSEEYQKVVDDRRHLSPGKDSQAFDINNYDRVVKNGVAVYKPKATTVTTTKLQAKGMQPSRDNYHTSKVTVINGYSSGVTRYEPTGRDYANSPIRREGASYQKALRQENPLRRPSNQTYERRELVPLKQQRVSPLVYDSKSPMKVTEYRSPGQKTEYRSTVQTMEGRGPYQEGEGPYQKGEGPYKKGLGMQQKQGGYTYNSPTHHVYQRREIAQPRVQASNFNDRVPVLQSEIGIISGIHKNSQIFELSDGSIMRRNNIKFGINKYKGVGIKVEEEFEYLGQMKSKVQSKVKRNFEEEENKNQLVEKRLVSEQQVTTEKEAYSYINTAVNDFCFLLDDELAHVEGWVSKYLKNKNDRVEVFRGMDQLYERIQRERVSQEFDVVFVFVKNEDLLKVNKKLLPGSVFIVEIMGQEFKGLEISQKQQHIKLSKLPYMKLAQKIILQTMLTHIILYQRNAKDKTLTQYFSQQVSHLLSLFPQSQFVKQPYDSPLSYQLLTALVQEPKFCRLYIICNEKEMANVVEQLSKMAEESGIQQEIAKIICIPQDNEILRHESKIESYSRVAWITNSSKIHDYKSLIKYALRQEEDDNLYAKQDSQQREKIFYHSRHRNLHPLIEKQFPQRFEFQAFNSLGEVEKKVAKSKNQKAKQTHSPNKKPTQSKAKPPTTHYLILHPILADEYVDTKLFKKIFMLGKSDKTQRKVVKVASNQELMELLKR